jgi:hypothetical protein
MGAQTRVAAAFDPDWNVTFARNGSSAEHGKAPAPSSLLKLRTALPPINSAITRLCRIKQKYGFDLDDIIIIAACGAINFVGAKQEMPFAQPANIASIAGYIRVPRETVRRKLLSIEAKGFVRRYSGGYLVNNVSEWLALAGLLAPERNA